MNFKYRMSPDTSETNLLTPLAHNNNFLPYKKRKSVNKPLEGGIQELLSYIP